MVIEMEKKRSFQTGAPVARRASTYIGHGANRSRREEVVAGA